MSNRTETATDIDCQTCGHTHLRDPDLVYSKHSDPHWCIARLGERLEQQAATIAKLPVYADTGRAFVPGVDHCWAYDRATGRRVAVSSSLQCIGDKWASKYGPTFYSTAAACEEAEGGR